MDRVVDVVVGPSCSRPWLESWDLTWLSSLWSKLFDVYGMVVCVMMMMIYCTP